jgi:hypothetical protein
MRRETFSLGAALTALAVLAAGGEAQLLAAPKAASLTSSRAIPASIAIPASTAGTAIPPGPASAARRASTPASAAAQSSAPSALAPAPPAAPTAPTAPTASAGPTKAPAGAPAVPATGEALKHAEALFNRYVELEHAFDPALVDLYSKDAHIISRVIVAGKEPRSRTWTGTSYKDLLGRALKKAKETKQDLNYYSSIVYLSEGSRVRIKALRFAQMQKAVSPMSLLVGPDSGGTWRIFEERSETHPLPNGPQPVN